MVVSFQIANEFMKSQEAEKLQWLLEERGHKMKNWVKFTHFKYLALIRYERWIWLK